jgi:hypothetical protein
MAAVDSHSDSDSVPLECDADAKYVPTQAPDHRSHKDGYGFSTAAPAGEMPNCHWQ